MNTGLPDDGDLEVFLGYGLPGSVEELGAAEERLAGGLGVDELRLRPGDRRLLTQLLRGLGLGVQLTLGDQVTQGHRGRGRNAINEFRLHFLFFLKGNSRMNRLLFA